MKKSVIIFAFLFLAAGCNFTNSASTNNPTSNSSPDKCATRAAQWYENYINNTIVKPTPGETAGTNSYVNHYFADSDTCYVVLHFTNFVSPPYTEYYAIYNPYENYEIAFCDKWNSITNQPITQFVCTNSATGKPDTSLEIDYLMQTYEGLPQGYNDPNSGNYQQTYPNPIPPGFFKDPNNP